MFVLTLSPGYDTNDDVVMQSLVDGTFGEHWPHLVFSNVLVGLGTKADGRPRQSGFDITVASEVMAIFCLAKDLDDLKERVLDHLSQIWLFAKAEPGEQTLEPGRLLLGQRIAGGRKLVV